MFRNCTSLTEFEVGEWVTDMSSWSMFDGCTNLKTIIAHPSTAPTIRSDTFRGIAEDGTLIYPTGSDYSSWLSTDAYYLGYYGWNDIEGGGGNEDEGDDEENNDYFWVKLEEDGEINVNGGRKIQYSYDRENWYSNTSNGSITAPANTYVWLKNTSNVWYNAYYYGEDFVFSKKASIGGNLSSLGDMREKNFKSLFNKNKNLTDASQLILPWDVLEFECFSYMFADCTSLVNAPSIIPAEKAGRWSCNDMFKGCTSLVNSPALPATTIEDSCYKEMFKDCTSLGTPPTLPATTLATDCYYSMFRGCESLITAPSLPATELKNSCYMRMFYGCTNLSMVECHAENISAEDCLRVWLENVSPTGTFIKKQGVTYPSGVDGIPRGWTIQNIA